ncbi:MAG: HD domain-containing protein [Chloroflexota bacterium]
MAQSAFSIITELDRFLGRRAEGVFLVGGWVRDALLGRPNNDLDFSVTGDHVELARAVANHFGGAFVLLGTGNALARVILPDKAARRKPPTYLDFQPLRGEDLQADLAQRDFTINALALPLARVKPGGEWMLEIIDPSGGRRDLEHRIVRAASPKAFSQDPIRLIRAVRLAHQLGFQIEPITWALLASGLGLLAGASPERIRDEFWHILSLFGAPAALRRLDELGLLTAIIPELAALKGVTQPPEHHWDVFGHSVETVAGIEKLIGVFAGYRSRLVHWPRPLFQPLKGHFNEAISADHRRLPLLKLAALLHDIAKPETRSREPDGRIRFLRHQLLGAEAAAEVMKRLRFSNQEIDVVRTVIANHLRPRQLLDGPGLTGRAVYRFFRDTGPEGLDTLVLSLADHLATRGPALDRASWDKHMALTVDMFRKYFAEKEKTVSPPRLLDGNDIMAVLGLEPGPLIGNLLEKVREAQAMGMVNNRAEALEYVREITANASP